MDNAQLDRLIAIFRFGSWEPAGPHINFHPTTDIKQAMECVEEMCEDAYHFRLDYDFVVKRWRASFDHWPNKYSAEADTPALAICRAIAKCLEEQMKIIKVEYCSHCPYRTKAPMNYCNEKKKNIEISPPKTFPVWCPLADSAGDE
jgi:hypothetical protein